MSKNIGYSIFPSTWQEQKKQLSELYYNGSLIFTSLHIAEEFGDDYAANAIEMLTFCKSLGYKIIADVAPRTLPIFNCHSLAELGQQLHLDIVRVDFGFTFEEIIEASKIISICLNASTLDDTWSKVIQTLPQTFYAMHNYYPRPETGLDGPQLVEKNLRLSSMGLNAMAFIPSDEPKRGPIFEGLPTLESHRNLPPYVAFVNMTLAYDIDWIFVGDGIISEQQARWIQEVCAHNVYTIPIILDEDYSHLTDKVYTIRGDSPSHLIRFQESREYATQGTLIEPNRCQSRNKGTLTIDNKHYKRYSGEIQLTKKDFPCDHRVNVIGHVPKDYHVLLDSLPNGSKIKLHKLAHLG